MPGISAVFTKVMDGHIEQARRSVQSLLNQAPYITETTAADPTKAPASHDAAAIAEYFSRVELQRDYIAQIEKPEQSSVAAAIVAKAQSDMVSQVERDYKTQRSVNRTRAMMHAASRRFSHADDHGPIAYGLVKHPQDLLRLDKGTPNEGSM